MKKRQTFVVVCLFGVAVVIVLSLNLSGSPKFRLQSKLLQTDEHRQFMSRPSLETFSMFISDAHDSDRTFDNERKEKKEASRCSHILSGMIRGKWIKRSLTPQEQTTIDGYLQKERGFYRIPPSYQRKDGKCGDVAYERSPQYPHMWFKAICNPTGDTPCCHTDKCTNASEADCRCPTCYDERQSIHAEYAQWKPEDDRCQIKNFTSVEACRLLNGTTLHFLGDSFIRHVFVALVVLLTNNPVGALKDSAPHKMRVQCNGMHQITWSPCRDYLDMNRTLCGGTVRVVYTQVFSANEVNLTLSLLQELAVVNKSLVVLGLGIHDNFNVKNVSEQFLFPFFNFHRTLATGTESPVSLVNAPFESGNIDASVSMLNINNTIFNNILNRTTLPVDGNSTPDNSISSSYRLNRPLLDSSSLKDFNSSLNNSVNLFIKNFNLSIIRQVIGGNSQLDVDRNLQPSHQTNLNITVNISRNNLQAGNYANVGHLDNLSAPINVNSPRFTKAQVDNLALSNVPIVRRNTYPSNSSQSVSQQPQRSSPDTKLWPRFLWVGTHAPGLLKSPKFSQQTATGVQSFNKNIYDILNDSKVPYLDTFAFTKGIVSFDGTHYGYGINMMKVNMLLTYIQHDLVSDPDWRGQ